MGEEEDDTNDVPIASWKPQSTVPMFTLYADDDKSKSSSVNNSVPAVSSGIEVPPDSTFMIGFDDLTCSSPTATSLFDSTEFDSLFQDFCQDILLSGDSFLN